jgi:hypothetical protein
MGNLLAVPQLDYLVRQQSQAPPCAPGWRFAACERGDLGPLSAIDLDGPPGARGIF